MKLALLLALALAPLAVRAEDTPAPAAPRAGWDFSEVHKIPVQSGGRLKPLDSFSREIVLFITGSRSFEGWDPTELLFAWITNPAAWEKRPFIQLSREDVRRQLGLDEKRTRFSPAELAGDSYLGQYAQHMGGPMSAPLATGAVTSKPDPRDQEMRRVLERLGSFRAIVAGDSWPVVPVAAPEAWHALSQRENQGESIRKSYAELMLAYRAADQGLFERLAPQTRAAVEGAVPGWNAGEARVISAEATYNVVRPFQLAWIFYILAFLAGCFALAVKSPKARYFRAGLFTFTGVGMLFHVAGIAVRCYIAGRPPVTNMYESIVWVAIGQMVFAYILYWVTRQPILITVSAMLGALTLIIGDAAPAMIDPGLHPLVPVLRSNYWLTIHVLTITLGYAAFMLSLGLGNVTLYQFLRGAPSQKISGLNNLTYRAQQFGVVLLGAGTILGGVWADYSWGRFWGWDPKEVWALIAFLGYVAILHARYTNLMSQFGYAAWTVISFVLVLMAWYGVNFVLGVGLHSYGFSSGGQGWVALFTLLQLGYVGAVAVVHKGRAARHKTARA